jgi:transaldolase
MTVTRETAAQQAGLEDPPGAGPLWETAATATDYWNDSCALQELAYAIERGAVGATSNPTIVGEVLQKEMPRWGGRIAELAAEHPRWTEDEVAWGLIEEMAAGAAELLLPIFERERGRKGRLSIQTNPKFYRDSDRLIEQGLHFSQLAPNMQVKIPATLAGLTAIEELTAAGVSINATVCFTVPQSLAVGQAVEAGLERAEAAGHDTTRMSPVCTIMVGRLDDWLGVLAGRDGIIVDPAAVHWAGIACIKRAYGIYRACGYRARLLAAAYRHHLHWSELIGGDITMTIPHTWQRRFNRSDVEVVQRFDRPVPAEILDQLLGHFDDFRRAYEPDGLTPDEFDSFGATVRTLRGFVGSYQSLVGVVRDVMLPNPDLA